MPSSQIKLYEEGCKKLCIDDEKREETRSKGKFTTDQRFEIATRLAAVMVYGNKSEINMEPGSFTLDEDEISIPDIAGGWEKLKAGDHLNITEGSIEETVNCTGLFSGRGNNKLGFAHQTYAEFLAARYLVENKVPVEQIMNMITCSTDQKPEILPQLQQTATWLAGMKPEILELVLELNPILLLYSDLSNAN